jgi:hypothetical protein
MKMEEAVSRNMARDLPTERNPTIAMSINRGAINNT